MDNEHRIAKAALAVGAYIYATQPPGDRYSEEPIEDVITDLMSDLRHFCADREIDFERTLRISADHFDAECELEE